jgi:predicted nucleic acid-binding protein
LIVVVDASVAVRWTVNEPASEHAASLVLSAHQLIAPDVVLLEVGNALARAKRRGRISPSAVGEGLGLVESRLEFQAPVARYARPALEIALRHGGSVYDACYLALARAAGAALATADEQQAEVGEELGILVARVRDGFAALPAL